jgi:hypothetical protein
MIDRVKRLVAVVALLVAVLAAAPARAESQGKDEGWEQVTTQMIAPGETIPATTLVGAAYAFIWAAAVVFLVATWRRTAAVEREIEALKRRIEERLAAEKKGAG